MNTDNTIEVHHVPAPAALPARRRTRSPGGLRRGVSSGTGMEPALQRRRGVRGHRRPASRWPEHPAAPAGRPDGDRPSAPAAPAGDCLRRSSGPCTGDAPGQRSLANRLAAAGGGGSHAQAVTTSSCGEHQPPPGRRRSAAPGRGAELSKLMPLSPGPRGLWAISPARLCRWNSAASPGDPPRRRTTRPPPTRAGQPAEPRRHWL
jgi:hypothetical protein